MTSVPKLRKFRICYDAMSERYARELGYLYSYSFDGKHRLGGNAYTSYAVVMVLP